MKTITIRRLDLQFDANQVTKGSVEKQAAQAIELINLTLQREPFGLGAQLFAHRDEIEVESRKSAD
ncbi:MAG: hypothetical protein FD140_4495 [Limisphaerales bacterium]|nr:MAG: hypothetical protein FD140_4495 [Limisphaerales bacterium]